MTHLRRPSPRSGALLAALLACGISSGAAQRLAPGYLHGLGAPPLPSGPDPRRAAAQSGDNTGGMIVLGLVGGAAGLVAGAYVGASLGGGDRVCGDDPCGLEGMLWGATLGESVVLPLGVHLANRGRGNYGTELLTSVVITTGGLVLGLAANTGVLLVVVPVAQLATSIALERRSGAHR